MIRSGVVPGWMGVWVQGARAGKTKRPTKTEPTRNEGGWSRVRAGKVLAPSINLPDKRHQGQMSMDGLKCVYCALKKRGVLTSMDGHMPCCAARTAPLHRVTGSCKRISSRYCTPATYGADFTTLPACVSENLTKKSCRKSSKVLASRAGF